MTQPLASISGIASGIQWRDLVDQIMDAEAARRFDPLAQRQSALRSQADAWRQFQTLVGTFRDAASRLQAPTSFDVFKTTLLRPASGRELVSVSAGEKAQPGSYAIEVLGTARAERLSGAVASSATTALGVAGSFSINGRSVTVTADDTLTTLRDKINTAAAGGGSTAVTATLLSSGTGVRLVLGAQATGTAGVELLGDGSGVLQSLGFTDGSVQANIGANGATKTFRVSSGTAAVATMLGIPLPTPSTITVGGQSITVDLENDSLTSIAARIAAATGLPDSARVMSEKVGSSTRYWLETDLPVEVDAGDAVNSARAMAVLGFTKEGRSGIAQVVAATQAYGDSSSGLAATGSSLLSNLTVNGQALALADGDTITIGGTRGDGTTVQHTFAVGAGSTLQDLLDAIGDDTSGFGAGSRTAAASLSAGRVQLSDGTAGDSALSLSLTLTRSGGSSLSLGTFNTANGTVGRDRVITAGADAQVRVDGQLIRSSTNTISSAIPGLTISALSAEVGAITTVQVQQDLEAVAKTLRDFATAYNAVQSWATTNSAAGGTLANSSSLRSMAQSMSTALLQTVVGATGVYTSAALAGLERDKNGVLSLKDTAFRAALEADPTGVRRLFSLAGSASDASVEFIAAGSKTQPSDTGYAVDITQVATQAETIGAAFATYSTAGTPDTMSITDGATGRTASVALADGDTLAAIVLRLNTAFAAESVRLTAEESGGALRIVSAEYGSDGGFTVAYTPGSADGTSTLGIAAGSYSGLDVAGSINGVVASGRGQILTGGASDDAEGLAIRYTGATARAAGSVTLSLGIGGVLGRIAQELASEASGAALQSTTATLKADAIDPRLDDIQKRLDARRDALIRQFVAMEGALAKSQALSSALTAQIDSLRATTSDR